MSGSFQHIIESLPYDSPFLFVDEILELDDQHIVGAYTFKESEYFYKGHFKDYPVTPGVILVECMAQIGLACFGIHLIGHEEVKKASMLAFSDSQVEFLLPVYPGEKVTVEGEKVYFRFGKLKCKVRMFNSDRKVVSRGIISGILVAKEDEE